MSQNTRESWHITASECAKWLDIARNTFSDRGYSPAIEIKNRKYYDIRQIIAETSRAGIVAGDDENIDQNYQRARLTRAQADLAEISALRERGLIAPTDLFATTFEDFSGLVCQTLEGLPGDIRRTDPQIGVRALETIETKIAEFRNLAADKCAQLAEKLGGGTPCSNRADVLPDTEDEAAEDGR